LAVGGDTVALSTTRGTLGAVTDNGTGTYTATLTSSTSAGTATVSGTVNGTTFTSTAAVDFVADTTPSASQSTISVSPASIVADGSSTSTIAVQLKDGSGNNLTVGGATVALSTTRGALSGVTDNAN